MVYYTKNLDYRHALDPLDLDIEIAAFDLIQRLMLVKKVLGPKCPDKVSKTIKELESLIDRMESGRMFANQLDRPIVRSHWQELIQEHSLYVAKLDVDISKEKLADCKDLTKLIPLSEFSTTLYLSFISEYKSFNHEERKKLVEFLLSKARYYGEERKTHVVGNIPFFHNGLVCCCLSKDDAEKRMKEILEYKLSLNARWSTVYSVNIQLEKGLLAEFLKSLNPTDQPKTEKVEGKKEESAGSQQDK